MKLAVYVAACASATARNAVRVGPNGWAVDGFNDIMGTRIQDFGD
jgi:hypothetical protein